LITWLNGKGIEGYKMIQSVKIGNQTYEIKEVECVDKHDTLAGQIRFYDSIIKIDSGLTNEQKIETILHECLHGVEYFMGLDLEEHIIRQLGKGLSMLFKDNKHLVEMMKEL
jgi:hypothetical protein